MAEIPRAAEISENLPSPLPYCLKKYIHMYIVEYLFLASFNSVIKDIHDNSIKQRIS